MSLKKVRSYLSPIRHLQITNGLPDPALSSFTHLTYAMKGLRRVQPTARRQPRLPVTPEILYRIHSACSLDLPDYDKTMLWAAFCMGFFGFMRSGEFTCPSMDAFIPEMLTQQDIAVDSHVSPTRLSVHLKCSKAGPFGTGTTLHLGATGDVLCPVSATLGYLAIRPSLTGPLLLFQDNSPLSRTKLVQFLRHALTAAGIDDSNFNGHSFRIGAATAGART